MPFPEESRAVHGQEQEEQPSGPSLLNLPPHVVTEHLVPQLGPWARMQLRATCRDLRSQLDAASYTQNPISCVLELGTSHRHSVRGGSSGSQRQGGGAAHGHRTTHGRGGDDRVRSASSKGGHNKGGTGQAGADRGSVSLQDEDASLDPMAVDEVCALLKRGAGKVTSLALVLRYSPVVESSRDMMGAACTALRQIGDASHHSLLNLMIHLDQDYQLGPCLFPAVAAACPKLQSFRLSARSGVAQVDKEGEVDGPGAWAAAIAALPPSLQTLWMLVGWRQVPQQLVDSFGREGSILPRLQEFTLRCKKHDGAAGWARLLAQHQHQHQSMLTASSTHLSWPHAACASGCAVSQQLHVLRQLDLSCCAGMHVLEVLRACPQLTSCVLGDIGTASLVQVLRQLPHLRHLKLVSLEPYVLHHDAGVEGAAENGFTAETAAYVCRLLNRLQHLEAPLGLVAELAAAGSSSLGGLTMFGCMATDVEDTTFLTLVLPMLSPRCLVVLPQEFTVGKLSNSSESFVKGLTAIAAHPGRLHTKLQHPTGQHVLLGGVCELSPSLISLATWKGAAAAKEAVATFCRSLKGLVLNDFLMHTLNEAGPHDGSTHSSTLPQCSSTASGPTKRVRQARLKGPGSASQLGQWLAYALEPLQLLVLYSAGGEDIEDLESLMVRGCFPNVCMLYLSISHSHEGLADALGSLLAAVAGARGRQDSLCVRLWCRDARDTLACRQVVYRARASVRGKRGNPDVVALL